MSSSEASAERPQRTQPMRRATSDRQLFAAAIKLVAERGSTGSTLVEIGREAGYSHALVGQRFGSKAAFVRALTEEIIEDSLTQVVPEALESLGPRDRVIASVDAYLEWLGGAGAVGRALYVLMTETLAGESESKDIFVQLDRALRSRFEGYIRLAIAEGELPASADPVALAVAVTAIVRGIALQWFLDDAAVDLRDARSGARWLVERALGGTGATDTTPDPRH